MPADYRIILLNYLKNQGYGSDHNYTLGKNNLSTESVLLMVLAFIVAQALYLFYRLFNAVLGKCRKQATAMRRYPFKVSVLQR